MRSKKQLSLKQQHQVDIVKSLEKYDKEFHPEGETLPDSTRVFRVKVVTALLNAGVPLSKLDYFRDQFEENGYALCDSSHLRRLVPFILQDEISKLKHDINGRHVANVFDGTTHVCEAFVIVLRYVDSDWAIKQRVCRLMLLAKSITGEECAHQLITTELSICQSLLMWL